MRGRRDGTYAGGGGIIPRRSGYCGGFSDAVAAFGARAAAGGFSEAVVAFGALVVFFVVLGMDPPRNGLMGKPVTEWN